MTALSRDRFGAGVESSSDEAVELLGQATLALVRLSGDPLALAERAAALDPALGLARALGAYLRLYAGSERAAAAARQLLDGAEPRARGRRERAHVGAAAAWAHGDVAGAVGLLEQALLEDPRDLLALKVAQDLYLQLGDRINLRDVVGRVLPAWPEEAAGSSYVRAMHAFGLEECGEYGRALQQARSALAADATDAWAAHALLHVHEMEGRPETGLEAVAETSSGWATSFFAMHNWWHAGLYHLELGDDGSALELYDERLRHDAGSMPFAALDAVSLLWRFALLGAPLVERAVELVAIFEPKIGDSTQCFNDWHAAMAFGLAGRPELSEALLDDLARRPVGTHREVADAVGLELVRGFAAFSAGEASRAVALLGGARRRAYLVGGSHAQRDVLDLTLLAAASAAGDQRLVRALVAERCARATSSAHLARRVVEANRPSRPGRALPRRPGSGQAGGETRPQGHQGDPFEGLDELALLEEEAVEVGAGWYGQPPVRRASVQTPAGALSALIWGDAPLEVVLLHGAALNAHTWDPVALILDRALAALDLPGHGDSPWREDRCYDPASLAPAVATAITSLAGGPVTIVGHSLGGATAIEVARLRPGLVAGLVLVDISPGMRTGRANSVRSFLEGPQVFPSRQELVGRAAAFGYGRSLAALERGVWHNTTVRPDGSVVWKHHLGSLPPAAPVDTALSALWEPLEAFEGDVLLVWAEDGFLGEEEAAELTERVRGAKAVRVPGGHNVQEDEPARLAAILRGFLT
ncbi:MAG: alpha/beta fold hydrolase [Acidimicrobiales bacterium]